MTTSVFRTIPFRRISDSGVRIQGSGFRDQDSGVRSQGSGVRIQGSGVRDQLREWDVVRAAVWEIKKRIKNRKIL
jgi:hypothetical protein